MAVPSSHCEAKKHAYRQTKDGIVISFVLHPNEVPDDLALAPLGARYMLGLARIGDDEEPLEPEQKPEKPKRPGRPFADMPASEQAGMLCKDAEFQRWARGRGAEQNWGYIKGESGARQFVLDECEISSRRELDTSSIAEASWAALLAKFHADTGRTTEQPWWGHGHLWGG